MAVIIALLLSKARKSRTNFFIMHLALAGEKEAWEGKGRGCGGERVGENEGGREGVKMGGVEGEGVEGKDG